MSKNKIEEMNTWLSQQSLPAMQETWVQSLGWEDPLEKETVTYSCIPAWRIAWAEEPVGLQSMQSRRIGHDLVTNTHMYMDFKNIWNI